MIYISELGLFTVIDVSLCNKECHMNNVWCNLKWLTLHYIEHIIPIIQLQETLHVSSVHNISFQLQKNQMEPLKYMQGMIKNALGRRHVEHE